MKANTDLTSNISKNLLLIHVESVEELTYLNLSLGHSDLCCYNKTKNLKRKNQHIFSRLKNLNQNCQFCPNTSDKLGRQSRFLLL